MRPVRDSRISFFAGESNGTRQIELPRPLVFADPLLQRGENPLAELALVNRRPRRAQCGHERFRVRIRRRQDLFLIKGHIVSADRLQQGRLPDLPVADQANQRRQSRQVLKH